MPLHGGLEDGDPKAGEITHRCYCEVTQDDLDFYNIKRGSCVGQQVLEGLVILVALRLAQPEVGAESTDPSQRRKHWSAHPAY